jgi:hypothetical protein
MVKARKGLLTKYSVAILYPGTKKIFPNTPNLERITEIRGHLLHKQRIGPNEGQKIQVCEWRIRNKHHSTDNIRKGM